MRNNVPEAKIILEHDSGYTSVAQEAIIVDSAGRIDRVTLIVSDTSRAVQRDPATGAVERDPNGVALLASDSKTDKKG